MAAGSMRAHTAAKGQANMDVDRLPAKARADREAGKNEEGEVGDTKGSCGAHRGIFKPHGNGKSPRARGESIPRLFPFRNIAIFKKPVVNSGVEHYKAIVKSIGIAVGVGRPRGKKGGELRVG